MLHLVFLHHGFDVRGFYTKSVSNDRQGHRYEVVLVDSKQSVFRCEANDRTGRCYGESVIIP